MPLLKPEPSLRRSLALTGALRVALLYAGVSAVWILVSDRVVNAVFTEPEAMTKVSIVKGWAFVAVTASMLFVMVKRLVDGVASREAKLQTLIHAIPDLVWPKDPQGVYLGCNRAFERLYGAPEAEIVGRTDADFVSPEQAAFFRDKDLAAIAAGATQENDEWVTQAETGQSILLQTLKTPIHDGAGTLIGVLGIGRDITERHRMLEEQAILQARLHQGQKMELVGRFAGGVAHDYNNLLGVIQANAELVLLKAPEGWPERRQLVEILRAARHSAELTAQLLAFARQQPSDPHPVDLNQALRELQEVVERMVGPGVHLEWRLGAGLWVVRADGTQLRQVLTNLVSNARDALGGQGRIEVATANCVLREEESASLVDVAPGEYVCLSVSDDGCGMSSDLLPKIFEPFFTTKPSGRGTGLGLAMVHGIVTQHHGGIQVESAPAQGTRFRVLLPRA